MPCLTIQGSSARYGRHIASSSAAMLSALCAVPFMTWMSQSSINDDVDQVIDVPVLLSSLRRTCSYDIHHNIVGTDSLNDLGQTGIMSAVMSLKFREPLALIGSPLFSLNGTHCEQQQQSKDEDDEVLDNDSKQRKRNEPLFFGLFPQRQLFQPKLPYPLWNYDWDGRLDTTISTRELRKRGVTRHIILVRHGQYDENHRQDEARVLTPLGEKQAHQTGQRLAQWIQSIESQYSSPHHHNPTSRQEQGKVVAIRVSNLTRAKQTANIIAQYLPSSVVRFEPDEDLNEGRPCHSIPCTDKPIHVPASMDTYYYAQQGHLDHTADHVAEVPIQPLVPSSIIRQTDEGHDRIERAFHRYFYRAQSLLALPEQPLEESDSSDNSQPHILHEYEIIVCHANVIRYFLCRALQIPPEAWLRFCIFNCSLTYFTIRPTGSVSCRLVGDIGHLDYDMTTFSMHHGFNW